MHSYGSGPAYPWPHSRCFYIHRRPVHLLACHLRLLTVASVAPVAHAPLSSLPSTHLSLTIIPPCCPGFYVVSTFLHAQQHQLPATAAASAAKDASAATRATSLSTSALEPILSASKGLCARPWPWVQQHLGHHVNVERYCTWGPYVVQLLMHGLGLDEHQVRGGKGSCRV